MFTRPRFWLIVVIIWFLALFALSHQSRLQPPGPQFENRDKVLHLACFLAGGTGFFLWLRLGKYRQHYWRAALWTVLFAAAAGAFDEFHQSFVPNRSGNDPFDWLADTAGGVLACVAGEMVYRVLSRLRGNQLSTAPSGTGSVESQS